MLRKCEIQLAYAIGVARPVSIAVDTFGTGKVSEEKLVELIRKNFDLRPAGIIKELDLRRPIYRQTAAYGHFGRNDLDVPWERTDKAEALKAQALSLINREKPSLWGGFFVHDVAAWFNIGWSA